MHAWMYVCTYTQVHFLALFGHYLERQAYLRVSHRISATNSLCCFSKIQQVGDMGKRATGAGNFPGLLQVHEDNDLAAF